MVRVAVGRRAAVLEVASTAAEAERFTRLLADRYGVTNPETALAPKLRNPDRNVFAKVSTSVIPNSYLELSYNFVNAEQDSLTSAPTAPSVPNRIRDGYQLSNAGYSQMTSTRTARAKITSTWMDGRLSNEFLTGFSILRDARDPPRTSRSSWSRPGGSARTTRGWRRAPSASHSSTFDSQPCLREAKGRLIQRGECRNPWQ